MSESKISLDFIGARLDEVQREQRRMRERLDLLGDQVADLRSNMLTVDLAERIAVRFGERLAEMDERHTAAMERNAEALARIEAALAAGK